MTINTGNLQLLSLLIQHLLNAFLPLFLPLGLITGCMCLCTQCESVSAYYNSKQFISLSPKYKVITFYSFEWLLNLIQDVFAFH